MPWTARQLEQHRAAARLLEHVRDEVWVFLRTRRRCTERQVQEFVLRQFSRCGLRLDSDRPIVAFRENTSHVHYFPGRNGSLRLRPNSWVLLDIWARLDMPRAPYADITWMAWLGGRVPFAYTRTFAAVVEARDRSLLYLKREVSAKRLPVGRAVDAMARTRLARRGYANAFLHTLGHSLGLVHPHGKLPGFAPRNDARIAAGMGYTIEPGVYLTGSHGARVEMDCYVTTDHQVIVTTELQQEIVRL